MHFEGIVDAVGKGVDAAGIAIIILGGLIAPRALAQGLYYPRGNRPVLRPAAATDFAGLPDRCPGRGGVAGWACVWARSEPALSQRSRPMPFDPRPSDLISPCVIYVIASGWEPPV